MYFVYDFVIIIIIIIYLRNNQALSWFGTEPVSLTTELMSVSIGH